MNFKNADNSVKQVDMMYQIMNIYIIMKIIKFK